MDVSRKTNLISICILFTLVSVISSCSGPQDGHAPSEAPTTTSNFSDSFIRSGTNVMTNSGWSADASIGDPIKKMTTTSGWTVEVRYE